jgi:hypothetical protein
MERSIHKKPSARQIQPIGLWGRLEAIKAPTKGKAKTGTEVNASITVRLATKPLGRCAERMRMYSATLATNMATERPASDHANQAAEWRLILPTLPPCSLAPSVTTPLYSTTVSKALR